MRLGEYVEKAMCQFCGKEHDGVEVFLDNGRKLICCWSDLKKIVKTGIFASAEKKL